MSRVVLLTGERAVGKSTICREAVVLARSQGYACGGILTLTENGVRDVYDVRSGDRRRLTQEADRGPGVVQGRFRFDPETLIWGSAVLNRSVPCDLLVVDEVGPLEIVRGEGWTAAFDVLRDARFTLGLVVVRPRLVIRAQSRLANLSTVVLTATEENRDRLPEVVVGLLDRETGDSGR